jgi:uncharacterized protein
MGEPGLPDDLEVLSESHCRELLATANLGRIAFSIDDVPEIFPVNYAADGMVVVFRTASGTKLREAVMRRVAFEVDDWDAKTGIGWSVVLKGIAQEVTKGIDPFASTLRERPVYPLAPGEREHWIAVYPSEVSGRRFHRG